MAAGIRRSATDIRNAAELGVHLLNNAFYWVGRAPFGDDGGGSLVDLGSRLLKKRTLIPINGQITDVVREQQLFGCVFHGASMQMVISPVRPADGGVYTATGEVHRVFDTNDLGVLLPIPFSRMDGRTFRLTNGAPHGQVYAEIATSQYG